MKAPPPWMDGWMDGAWTRHFFHWILVPLLMGTKNGRTHSETEDPTTELEKPTLRME
jgi:hypothetical protein